jgi:hypothetical protein
MDDDLELIAVDRVAFTKAGVSGIDTCILSQCIPNNEPTIYLHEVSVQRCRETT